MKTQPQYVKNFQCFGINWKRGKIEGSLLSRDTTHFFKCWKLLGFGDLKALLILVASSHFIIGWKPLFVSTPVL